jgi:protein-disulfide isomerase
MLIKIFWRDGCPKCPPAKELGKKLSAADTDVKIYNLNNAEGLAEATLYGVMSTPATVISDEKGKEVVSWRGETPSEDEIKNTLNEAPRD